jgi:hypothetical protein
MNRVIDRKKMGRRQLAAPVDIKRLSGLCFDGGAGPRTVISPERCGRKIAMHLLLELTHLDFDNFGRLFGANNRREEERIDVTCKSDTAANLSGLGHGLTDGRHTFAKRKSRGCV